MDRPPHTPASRQALRIKRARLGLATYVLGFSMLALCTALGLFEPARLLLVGALMVAVNAVLFTVLARGWNLRCADPSLTLAQVGTGVAMVALIMVLGSQVQFLAVPFYSSLFVFAMLKLGRRELLRLEAFVLVTYCAALLVRVRWLGNPIDLRLETINFALVVLSSVWYVAAADYISGLRARLRNSVQTIEELATRDGLTGTWNRRHIDALLDAELQRKQRIGGRLCVALVDVDHFKSVNDRHGHPAGDEVLRRIASAMGGQLRSIDQLGRFGGEEFLLLLPGATIEEAARCAERLRADVALREVLPGAPLRVSISIGVAECHAAETAERLLERVDRALYRAKHLGRNRVELDLPLESQAA